MQRKGLGAALPWKDAAQRSWGGIAKVFVDRHLHVVAVSGAGVERGGLPAEQQRPDPRPGQRFQRRPVHLVVGAIIIDGSLQLRHGLY